jgi:hypothetical protein
LNDKLILHTTISGAVKKDTCNYVSGALPLNIFNFEGETNTFQNVIRWSASDNDRILKFVLEIMDNNDKSFIEKKHINFVEGQSEYVVVDNDVKNIAQYYRLKVILTDQSVIYSPTITLRNTLVSSSVVIFPNPASERLHVKLNSSNQKYLYEVIDLYGSKVLNGTIEADNEFVIPVNHLNKGNYLIKIISDKVVETHRFQIEK